MYRELMSGKLHRATVTEANLHYVGSITIDRELMDAVGIIENEKVQVVNNNNGARFETYVIPGEKGTKTICINGAAARLVQPGDIVIIISYKWIHEDKCHEHKPKVAILNEKNEIVKLLYTEHENTMK